MADSSKSNKGQGDSAADKEAKAREKAARKAAFLAEKGAEIEAAKAKKEQNKKQGKNKNQQPPAAPIANATTSAASTEKSKGNKAESTKGSPSQPEKKKPEVVDGKKEQKPPIVDKPSSADSTPKLPKSSSNEAVIDIAKGISNLNITVKKSILKTSSSVAKGGGRAKEQRAQSRVQTLFDHLPKGVEPGELFGEDGGVSTQGIYPGFIALGLMYSHGQLQGSNKRCIALLNVVGQFFESYSPPPEKDFKYDIAASLKRNLEFLRKCRPFAVAMNNTVEFINGILRDIKTDEKRSEKDIKNDLAEHLQVFREERIDKATEAIVAKAKAKIVQEDVVLVYGSSDLVREVVVEASKEKSFSVIIIDGRPYATERRSKGLDIIKDLGNKVHLVKYTSITGLSNVIRSVTKVILGAHALLNNGGVLAHAGTSQIALMAAANNIPVIVCCETLKFCDKSPTDSFFLNELGTGFGLDKKYTEAMTAEYGPYLVTPVIKYDVTPPELVTAVITDVDILPCTSVPVVLRVQENRTFKP